MMIVRLTSRHWPLDAVFSNGGVAQMVRATDS